MNEHNHKVDDDILIKVKIKSISDDGELSFVQSKGYTTCFQNRITKRNRISSHTFSFHVLTKEFIPLNQIELLNKQYEELIDRYDVAAKALELLITSPINYSNVKDVAAKALEQIEQMIKDYNDKNELR